MSELCGDTLIRLICYVDGGCLRNGTPSAAGYGSYKIYKVFPQIKEHSSLLSNLLDPVGDTEIQLVSEVIKEEHIALDLGNGTLKLISPTNNTAEGMSLLSVVEKLISWIKLEKVKEANKDTQAQEDITKAQEPEKDNEDSLKRLHILIYTDSELLQKQVLGYYNVKNVNLRDIVHQVQRKIRELHTLCQKEHINIKFEIKHLTGVEMKKMLGH